MEVEVVRFNENDDNSMECIVIKKSTYICIYIYIDMCIHVYIYVYYI